MIRIFISIGCLMIAASIVAIIITFVRIQHEKQAYIRGYRYEDEYGVAYERLRSAIPYYGMLLLVGLLIIIFNLILAVE